MLLQCFQHQRQDPIPFSPSSTLCLAVRGQQTLCMDPRAVS